MRVYVLVRSMSESDPSCYMFQKNKSAGGIEGPPDSAAAEPDEASHAGDRDGSPGNAVS